MLVSVQPLGSVTLNPPEFVYSLFGLQIAVNRDLPEISQVQLPSSREREADSATEGVRVEVQLGTGPKEQKDGRSRHEEIRYQTEDRDANGVAALTIWKSRNDGLLRLEYFDGTRFWLNETGSRVWATWPERLTLEDTATYLLGPVLGLLLRLRGVTCLHASAVSIGNAVVAFVGEEGAGKSTTAAALGSEGSPIVSDDVVALVEKDGTFYVHPAYPYLCLWPESVEAIYGSADALPRFSENYEKRCLSLKKKNLQFEKRSLPLRAIYVLRKRRSDRAPAIERVSAQESLVSLIANTFATNVLDGAMRAKEFETLGRLVPKVKISEVFPHEDAGRLPELCRLIRMDAQESEPGPDSPLPFD